MGPLSCRCRDDPVRESQTMNPLGDNLIVLLMLALGGALAVGNFMALVRPREDIDDDELERPPLGRAIVMIVIGLVATVWALVSLIAG